MTGDLVGLLFLALIYLGLLLRPMPDRRRPLYRQVDES